MQRFIERVPTATSGHVGVTRPSGTVDITVGGGTTALDAAVEPPVLPVQQLTNLVCWAAAGTMMESWRARLTLSVEAMLDGLGGTWRARYDRNEGLSVVDFRAFTTALGLVEDPPQSYTPAGLATLLTTVGPLLAIGDDAVESNQISHARVIDSVKGDGTLDGTTVMVADSATGTFVPLTFRVFDQLHGTADPLALGLGLMHF
jgi:Papain-like cysteine protease AvrRpt2